MSKTILAQVEGWTVLIDSLSKEHGLVTSAVFGRIWRFCGMADGVCTASLQRIADDLGLDRATVMRHAQTLVTAGYLNDLTPQRRNRPHTYADTGKAGIVLKISSVAQRNTEETRVAESNITVAQRNTRVAESQLKRQLRKKERDSGADSPTPRTPDLLFDSICEVCGIDSSVNGNGAKIGKVKADLLRAKPPYTPDEIRTWGRTQVWRTTPPTVWQLKEQIGAVRKKAPLKETREL